MLAVYQDACDAKRHCMNRLKNLGLLAALTSKQVQSSMKIVMPTHVRKAAVTVMMANVQQA